MENTAQNTNQRNQLTKKEIEKLSKDKDKQLGKIITK